MKKLFQQFVKFGMVGFLCFFIDYGVFKIVTAFLRMITNFSYCQVIGNVIGFSVSVIVNYILSMKYVFARKDDMDKRKEFLVFVVLSVLGCLLNTLIVWGISDPMYHNVSVIQELFKAKEGILESIAKVVATAVVMVYNFVTRKIFLEDKKQSC